MDLPCNYTAVASKLGFTYTLWLVSRMLHFILSGPFLRSYHLLQDEQDVQIHLKALFQDLVNYTGRVKTSANRYNTDKTKSNPRASVGL